MSNEKEIGELTANVSNLFRITEKLTDSIEKTNDTMMKSFELVNKRFNFLYRIYYIGFGIILAIGVLIKFWDKLPSG